MNQNTLQLSHHFDDFDAFAKATRGWDLDFWQLDSGPFEAEFAQTLSPSTILIECAFSRKIEQRGAPPSGYRTVGFAADDTLDLKWRGKSVGPEQLMLFPHGAELESISQPGFHVFAFSMSEQTLSEAAALRGLDSLEDLFPAQDLITFPPRVIGDIRRCAAMLSRPLAGWPDLIDKNPFHDSFEFDLVDSILNAIAASSGAVEFPLTARSRTRAVKAALDIIADRSSEPVSIAEIARLTGVTARTLRYAFEETYGLSPKQYLQAYRLNKVHRQLRRAREAGQNVSDVANAWGFWHMGQFARDYRRMFGALPGATLKSG